MASYDLTLKHIEIGPTAAISARRGSDSLAARLLNGWLMQRRNKRELADLTDDQLRDAGISRDARREALKTPFWRL